MSVLIMIVAAILLLGPLIAIHEFGHYWVARRLGVKVLTYSIGFGPKLIQWTSKKSGIQYRLALLPFGGYVKMLDEREGEVAEAEKHLAFNRQSVWKRFAIVFAGPATNLILAVFLYWILFLPTSEQLNTRIGKIIPHTPAAEMDLRVGDKIVTVDGEETPTWEKLNYQLLARVGETGNVQLQIERQGQLINKSLPIYQFVRQQQQSPLQSLGFLPYMPAIKPIIAKVSLDSVAQQAGLQAKDEIKAINGKAITDWRDMVEIIQKSPNTSLQMTILRDGKLQQIAITPQAKKDVAGKVYGSIGVEIQREKWNVPAEYKMYVKNTPTEAVVLAVDKTWQLSVMTVSGIVKMIKGLIGIDNISGPITIAKVAGQSVEMGWQAFFSFMALMSVSLGVLNLLPIPMLDGGHLVYYTIEALRGRPISDKVQLFGLRIGITILGTMMLLALFNDIMRL